VAPAADVSIENRHLRVTFDRAAATFAVTDTRSGHTWSQQPVGGGITVEAASAPGDAIEVTLLHKGLGLRFQAKLALDGDKPELLVELTGQGRLKWSLGYPYPFISKAPTYLVIPMNEGISYPVNDPTIKPRRLVAYGGHGMCMAFWGVTDGACGHMAILETADDASIAIRRHAGNLCVAPHWDAQKGSFGYTRRLRYAFFDRGGHVAFCKRYRTYAEAAGRLKTLARKRSENPHVDLLIGAVNVWCWEGNALALVKELQAAGIERILWSRRQPPPVIRAMNELHGVLTSRYDIYQDLMDPRVVKEKLRRQHPDWTQAAWPDDLMLGPDGDWRKGWRVRGRDGVMYPCGVLCDRQALKFAARRVPEELKTHPFRCRFIDTTTASPWRECYHPDHPMTRGESRRWKMELLRYMSEEMKLVTGSETGHDAAVPFVHYFEGMLSLGPYRVPDAGRRMATLWHEVPERVARFQVGHRYRLPLWELVYHDCVVAQWYWGDYNNKLPALWDKRDLFNILYGTPPMFMFTRETWKTYRDRFVRSYRDVCPVARAVGYAAMVDHRFLTADRDVQQTAFANGVTVTVNFGEAPSRLPDGTTVGAGDHHVTGVSIK
jgi:hypothetical protein